MMTIDVQQVKTRVRTVPENLRDIFYSPQTAEAIDRIGMENHLSDDKVSAVAEAAGLALLGFIHPEELTGEIQSRAQVDPRVAQNLSAALQNRILNSIRADLDKIYAPAGEEPTKMEDISRAAPAPGLPPVPTPTAGMSPAAGPAPKAPVFAPKPGGAAPKPFLDLSQLSGSAPTPPAGPRETGGAIPPTGGVVAPASAPVFLQQKTESQPIKTGQDFRLKFESPQTAVRPPTFGKPAQLEIGQQPAEAVKQPQMSRVEAMPSRTVHYSQWRTPLEAPAPTAASAPQKPAPLPISHLSSPSRMDMTEAPKVDTAPPLPEIQPAPQPETPKKPDMDTILAKLAPERKPPAAATAKVVNFVEEKPAMSAVPPAAPAAAKPPIQAPVAPPPPQETETPPKAAGGTVDLSSL